jgi:hypothetical protein
MIQKYLSKLKIFQFKMNFSPLTDKDKDEQLNEIIDTYRTKFWIDEHQWFVRCHWRISSEQNQSDRIELFNLPYSFSIYSANANYTISKSTCPSNSEYLICKQVTFLDCRSSSSIASDVHFSNIKNLLISLPFNDQLLTHVPTLDRLTSVTLYQDKDANLENIRIQLQLLLNRAPYLRALYFFSWSVLSYEAVLLKITSVSVRSLYLLGSFSHDDEQYIELSRSPFRANSRISRLYLIF